MTSEIDFNRIMALTVELDEMKMRYHALHERVGELEYIVELVRRGMVGTAKTLAMDYYEMYEGKVWTR